MKFSVACRLLSSKDEISLVPEARKYLDEFVFESSELYGKSFMSLNIHGLSHVSNDDEYSSLNLNQLNAFAFLSFLDTVSRDLRSPKHLVAHYPLLQENVRTR